MFGLDKLELSRSHSCHRMWVHRDKETPEKRLREGKELGDMGGRQEDQCGSETSPLWAWTWGRDSGGGDEEWSVGSE